jgi:hypothetical protein
MELQLICEICREPIGRFDPEAITLPLKGEMFKPLDDVHGYPPPFNGGATWEYFHCIRDQHPEAEKRHRPIVDQAKILTNMGYFEVGGSNPGEFLPVVELFSEDELEKEWNERVLEFHVKQSPKKEIKVPKTRKRKRANPRKT